MWQMGYQERQWEPFAAMINISRGVGEPMWTSLFVCASRSKEPLSWRFHGQVEAR